MQFSVVIPCHNAATSIGQTLRSVAAQTLAPHEIIVVDDNSTDNSRAEIEKSGVDVTLIAASFGNAGAARNLGIEQASGDYVALCDADDLWFAHHLQQAAQVLSGGADIAYMANHCLLDANGQTDLPAANRHYIAESGGGKTGEAWIDELVGGFHFGHSSVIYRRDILQKIGGFDVDFERQEDLDLWLRAIGGGTWAYGAQSAMAYRVDSAGSLSKAVIKSAYFYVRALLKNRAYFSGAALQTLIARNARHALSLAFVDGTRADFEAAWRLTRPHLSPGVRAFYRVARPLQFAARGAIRLKRRWVWRGQPEVGARHYE